MSLIRLWCKLPEYGFEITYMLRTTELTFADKMKSIKTFKINKLVLFFF